MTKKEYCPLCLVFYKDKSEVELIYLADNEQILECRYCGIHGIIDWDPDKDES